MNKVVWLVGSGYMGEEYLKILSLENVTVTLVGNTYEKTFFLAKKYNVSFISGGFERITPTVGVPEYVILACSIDQLATATEFFINLGVKNILVEKPVTLSLELCHKLFKLETKSCAKIWVAYNRRYYSSVEAAKRLIAEDGGILSLSFDFTEWDSHYDAPTNDSVLKNNWLVANSSHVIDLVFHLIGIPKSLAILKNNMTNGIFIGQGISVRDIPFSYHSNWRSAGRWGIEVMTSRRRLFFRPLEKLQIQEKNSMHLDVLEPELVDTQFKPGLAKLVKAFLGEEVDSLIPLAEHLTHLDFYLRIQANA